MIWNGIGPFFTWNSVVLSVIQLSDTMPVNRCSVTSEFIRDVDDNIITPVSRNLRSWDGTIEVKSRSRNSISTESCVLDNQPILQINVSYELRKKVQIINITSLVTPVFGTVV